MTHLFSIFKPHQTTPKTNTPNCTLPKPSLVLLLCLLWVSLVACGNVSPPRSPLATPTTNSLAHSPLVTPTSPPTAAPTTPITPSPTLYLPTFTPTPILPTDTPTIAPTSSPWQVFGLPLALNRDNLSPPVKQVVYLTITDANTQSSDLDLSILWQANVSDITQATPIFSYTHRSHFFPNIGEPSPDKQYLVYGRDYNDRTGLSKIWLLDLTNGHHTKTDEYVFRSLGSPVFAWTDDSQSFVYVHKDTDGWYCMLSLYNLNTHQAQTLVQLEGRIHLAGWHDSTIYYMAYLFGDDNLHFKGYHLDTGETETLFSIPDTRANIQVLTAPHTPYAFYNYRIIDLQAKTLLADMPTANLLWLPDGEGLLGVDSHQHTHQASVYYLPLKPTSVLTPSPQAVDYNSELIAFSPDGTYVIYKNEDQDTYHLLNTTSGEVQTFPSVPFIFSGWLH